MAGETPALRLGDFHSINVFGAVEGAAEDDVFFVGGEGDVGFDAGAAGDGGAGDVVVVFHVDQFLAVQCAVGFYAQEVDPLAIGGEGDLAGVAAVGGVGFAVLGHGEM